MELTTRFKIGLFLFSRGDEIVEYAADEIQLVREFALQRYLKGKAFVEKLIADYEGGSFALSDESLKFAALQAIADDDDFEARVGEICLELDLDPVEFTKDIVRECIENPDTVRSILEGFKTTATKTAGIPDDFEIGIKADAASRAWHMEPAADWQKIWKDYADGSNVLCITLDTGTTPNHPDIPEQAFPPESMVPGEPSGLDRNFHGTHCQSTNTGQNGIGVAPGAKSGSIQVLSARGSGLNSWIAAGINRALDIAKEMELPLVLSISIGGGGPDAATTRALLRAKAEGAIVCAAAGNDGYQGLPTTDWPANDVNAASIAAYAENGLIAGFSSGGPDVDIAFPGQNILGADYRGGRSYSSGTSMATPGAAGYACLQQDFRLRNGFALLKDTTEFIAHCTEYATDAGSPGEDNRFGSGIMKIFEVMAKQKPDDVDALAANPPKPPTRLASLLFAFLFSLVACGPCNDMASGQDTVEVQTVVTMITKTEVYVAGKKVSTSVNAGGSETKVEKMLSISIDETSTQATLIGTDLEPRTIEAHSPGKFVIEKPGDYLLLAGSIPEYKRIKIEAPKPEFDLTTIQPLTKKLADSMDDPRTRATLAAAYANAAGQLEGLKLPEAKSHVQNVSLSVWAGRTGSSRYKDWVNGFRRPMQKEFDRLGFDNVALYRAAMEEVVKGLKQ